MWPSLPKCVREFTKLPRFIAYILDRGLNKKTTQVELIGRAKVTSQFDLCSNSMQSQMELCELTSNLDNQEIYSEPPFYYLLSISWYQEFDFLISGTNTLTGYEARQRTGERPEYEHMPFVMVIRWPRTPNSVAHESKNRNNVLK